MAVVLDSWDRLNLLFPPIVTHAREHKHMVLFYLDIFSPQTLIFFPNITFDIVIFLSNFKLSLFIRYHVKLIYFIIYFVFGFSITFFSKCGILTTYHLGRNKLNTAYS